MVYITAGRRHSIHASCGDEIIAIMSCMGDWIPLEMFIQV